MPGWNIPSEGTPYFRPVEPNTPVAPQIPTGERYGNSLIAAFTQRAISAQNAELEHEKMLQDGDLTARGLDLKAKDQQQEYELKKMLYGSYQTNADANMERARKGVSAMTEEAARRQQVNDELLSYNDKVRSEPEYGVITNAAKMASDPVGWSAAFRRFKDNHASDQVSIAADVIKQYAPRADQQKVPFRDGAFWVPGRDIADQYGQTTTDPGHFDMSGATLQHVPVGQLAEKYAQTEPGSQERDRLLWGLMAAGQSHIATSIEKLHGKTTEKVPRDIVRRTNVLSVSPTAQGILDAGEKTDFSRGRDITPQVFAHAYKKGGALGVDYGSGNPNPNPDYVDPNDEAAQRMDTEQSIPVEPDALPGATTAAPREPGPIFEPTESDTTLQQARAALSKGAPRDQVMQLLQSKGIDPSSL